MLAVVHEEHRALTACDPLREESSPSGAQSRAAANDPSSATPFQNKALMSY